uniref:Transmembrane protein 201 n=1 Tax=Latimeria chalumnae TaxID=7897 RepID=H3AUX2_LATCH
LKQNGDYNKPIPAQHMEHLNHVVSGNITSSEALKPQQWVNSRILLCKKCHNNQAVKIKQLASFAPREEDKYDDEIEVYKHHLEQTYKLCRPCQTAVEYIIKHQNRQLRAILFNHQLKCRGADKAYVQVRCHGFHFTSIATPVRVIFLRFLAFLSCAFLVALAIYGSGGPSFTENSSSVRVEDSTGPLVNDANETAEASENANNLSVTGWQDLITLIPEGVAGHMKVAWNYGQHHQMAVVSVGLLTCLLAVFLAGRVRLRRIDALASVLWLMVMGLHLTESYIEADVPNWLDTLKFCTTSLCCLVGFTSAVATRKSSGQRRYRPRRYLSGDSVKSFYSGNSTVLSSCPSVPSSVFFPEPLRIPQMTSQQLYKSKKCLSPSSLPGRLNRALSLGTIPSFARTDSGYLFSGSRPPSQASQCKDSPPSDYFSLISGSRPSSPTNSPAPSVAGSVTSSSSSLRYRRPLISPARLNLNGQKLQLFRSHNEAVHTPTSSDDVHNQTSNVFISEFPDFPSQNHGMHAFVSDIKSVIEEGSISSNKYGKKEDSSSSSSACLVDTTTDGRPDSTTSWKGLFGNSLLQGLLGLSLTVNVIFIFIYLSKSLH